MSNKTKRIGFRVTESQYAWLVDNVVHISGFFGELLEREIMSNKKGFVSTVCESDTKNVEQSLKPIGKYSVEQCMDNVIQASRELKESPFNKEGIDKEMKKLRVKKVLIGDRDLDTEDFVFRS